MKFELTHGDHILTLTEASEMELRQLNISLTGRIPHWRWDPRVQKGYWDGRISYFKNNKYVPSGLWGHIENVCKKFGYSLEIKGIERKFDNIDYSQFKQWCYDRMKDHNLTPYDYQINTAYEIIRNIACSNELATSAGKTLITFLVLSYLLETGRASKILMIVPTTDLVMQGYEDFFEYNMRKQDLKIQQVYEGAEIKKDANIVIGTYQTLTKKKKDVFDQFDAVCVDELHKVKSNSIKSILGKCIAKRRFGLTGTFPEPDKKFLDYLTISAYTGPLVSKIKASELQRGGYIADCSIKQLRIKYGDQKNCEGFRKLRRVGYDGGQILEMEKEFARNNKIRKRFITDLVKNIGKNTLLLFFSTDYGNELYNHFRNELSDKHVYYVDGGVDKNVRAEYKKKMERGDNKIMLASFGTFSTGINIKNLHNIIFLESFKSDQVIRQSIGRGLRKHKNKGKINIIDLVDDFRVGNYKNSLLKHGESRIQIYKEQEFEYEIKNIDLIKYYKKKDK